MAITNLTLSNISGQPDQDLTFSSSIAFSGTSTLSGTAYDWEWVTVPAGSQVGQFNHMPAASSNSEWFDMSKNVVYHQMSSSIGTQFPNSAGSNSWINMSGSTGLWHLDGNANDTSGMGKNGTVSGATSVDSGLWMVLPGTGVRKQAYKFDGSNDEITTTASATNLGINGNNDRSTSWWMRWDGSSCAGDWIWSIGNNSTRQAWGAALINNQPSTQLYIIGWDDNLVYTLPRHKQHGGWTHCVATYKGADRLTKLYIDGELVMDHVMGADLNTSNSHNLNFGGRLNSTNNFWGGWIQEFAMFNEVLTDTDVANIFNNQKNVIGNSSDRNTSSYDIIAPPTKAHPYYFHTGTFTDHFFFDGNTTLQTQYSGSQVELDSLATSGQTWMMWMKHAQVDDAYVDTWDSDGVCVFDVGDQSTDNSQSPRHVKGLRFIIQKPTTNQKSNFPDSSKIVSIAMPTGYSSRNFNMPNIDEWNHIAFVYNDTSVGGSRMSFYLNGERQFRNLLQGGDGRSYRLNLNDTPIMLGGDYSNTHTKFSGSIAEFAVFTGSLTESDIKSIYHKQISQGFRKDAIERFHPTSADRWLDTTDMVCAYRLGEYTTEITGTALPSNGGSNSFINMSGSVGLWHLNGNLLDDSPNNNNGTISGDVLLQNDNALFLQSGSNRITNTYFFDGTNDWIDTGVAPGTLGVAGGAARTFMIWFRRQQQNNQDYKTLWSCGVGSNNQDFTAYSRSNNRIQLNSWGGDLTYDMDNASDHYDPYEWNHVAWIYDGAGTNTLVVNGISRGTQSKTLDTSNTNTIKIGHGQNYGGSMHGNLQEFAIFDEALPVSDVLAIYNAQKNTFAMTDYSGRGRHITGSLPMRAKIVEGPAAGWKAVQFNPANKDDDASVALRLHPATKYDLQAQKGVSISMWTKQSWGDHEGGHMMFYTAPDGNSNNALYLQEERRQSNAGSRDVEAIWGGYNPGEVHAGNFFYSGSQETGDSPWQHVVGTFGPNNQIRLYRNGKLYAEKWEGSQDPPALMEDVVIYLGSNAGHNDQIDQSANSGSIAEFAMWEKVLQPAEVSKIYHAQVSGSYGSAQTFGPQYNSPQITFRPDVAGTYTIRLAASGSQAVVYATATVTAAASSPSGSGFPSQIRAVVQFTGSYGPSGVYDEYGAIATGSIVANDLNDVLSHMASSIKRIHLNDNLDFTYGAAGNIWKHPRPNSDGAHDLGTQGSPWSNLIIGNYGRGLQFGSSQDVKLTGIVGSGIEVFADADGNDAADTFEFRSTADLVLSSSTTVSVKTFGDNRVLVASGSSAYSTFLSSFSAGSQSLLDALSSLAVGGGRIKEVVEISSSTTSVTFTSLTGLDTSPDDFEIFVNGTLMREGSGQDYEAASSDTLTFAFTLERDDIVTGCKG